MPKNKNKTGTLAFDMEEALCNVLLGEKIPLDVSTYPDEPGGKIEILIPAHRKITRTLIRKIVANHTKINIDPSPIRRIVKEKIAACVTAHEVRAKV